MPFLGKTPSQIVDPEVDIDGGTIDGVSIGSVTANAGAFTNLTATGTLTLPDDGISGDDVNGGTISNFASTGIDDNATSTAITIDASQNVGIGTANPDGTFHVKDAIAQVYIQSNDGQPAHLVFGDVTDASGGMIEYTSSNEMTFKTNNLNERMRIDASGKVGIGTTSPSQLLSVKGTVALEATNSTNAWLAYTYTDNTFRLNFNGAGADEVVVDSSGNVGIGTASPTTPMHIQNSAVSPSWSAYAGTTLTLEDASNQGTILQFVSPSSYTTEVWFGDADSRNSGRIRYEHSGDKMELWSNGAERVAIDNSGNVGIENTSPSCLLQVGKQTASSGTNKKVIANFGGYYSATNAYQYQVIGFAGTIPDTSDITLQTGGESSKNFYMGLFADVGYFNSNRFSIYNNGAERLTVQKSTGNVGIGTASPSARLDLVGPSSTPLVLELNSANANCDVTMQSANTSSVTRLRNGTNDFQVHTNGTERLRIDASGNVLVGTTTNPSNGKVAIEYARGTSAGMRIKDTVGSGGTGVIADFYNSGNTSMGAITHDSSNITYGGTSDYRLKENLNYEFDGLATVAQLKPTKFTWIDNPNVGVMYGFIAHEVSDVVDQAVVGEKDAVNEDGSVKPQMLDQSKLIPFLTKAIQEQQAIIEDLQTRLSALEAN